MVTIRDDLRHALGRVAFVRALGLEPDPWQQDFLRSTSDRVLLNCCRQSGKSTITSIIALHRALYTRGSLILLLAPTLRQSQELFGKVLGFYRRLKQEGAALPARVEQRLSLELENDSRIVTLPGQEKNIRGFSNASLLVVDEAARVDDELYYSVRPMLAVSGGSLIMLSTPWGQRGVFYEEWVEGKGWDKFEVPAREVPRISPEFLEEERRVLGKWRYEQEYECVFGENVDAAFDIEAIRQNITDEFSALRIRPIFKGGMAS
jgi:hypothetical protein